MIHSSRRPASAQKVKVARPHTRRVEQLLRPLQVERVALQLLVVEAARAISELPNDGAAIPEKAAWFIARRLIAYESACEPGRR